MQSHQNNLNEVICIYWENYPKNVMIGVNKLNCGDFSSAATNDKSRLWETLLA